jgi:Neuraminidase (sialidase)
VYLIWQDVENQVYFKASHDQGKTWGNELLLGKVGKHSCYCYPPALSVTGKELVIVWTDYRESNKGVSVRFSGFPLFRSQKGKMVSSVVCRISRDGGRTWGKDKVLTSTTVSAETKDEIDNPTMLSDGSLSYCFWLDKRDLPLGEIYYARFDPARDKFPVSGKPLFSGEKRSPKRPSATFDEKGNVHMSWASFFQGLSTLSYGAIDPQGNILKERKELTAVIGRFHNPIITRTPSGLMYVFWFDEPKDKEKWSRIFLKTSKDNGATWADWEPLKKDIQQ